MAAFADKCNKFEQRVVLAFGEARVDVVFVFIVVVTAVYVDGVRGV